MIFVLLIIDWAIMVIVPLGALSYDSRPWERAYGTVAAMIIALTFLPMIPLVHQGYVQALSRGASLSENGLEIERTPFQKILTNRPAAYPLNWVKRAHLRRFPFDVEEIGEVALTTGDKFLVNKGTFQKLMARLPLRQLAVNEYENPEAVLPDEPFRINNGRFAFLALAYLPTGFLVSYALSLMLDMAQIQRLLRYTLEAFIYGVAIMFLAQAVLLYQFRKPSDPDGIQNKLVKERNEVMIVVVITSLFMIVLFTLLFHVFPPG